MENASKALLIAGAILIVILLIAVGMLVYSQSRGAIDTGVAQMSSSEINMFNSQFNTYEGTQSRNGVRMLLEKIIDNNKENEKKIQVRILYRSPTNGLINGVAGRWTNQKNAYKYAKAVKNCFEDIEVTKFTVKIYYDDNGLIDYCDIIGIGTEEFAKNNPYAFFNYIDYDY